VRCTKRRCLPRTTTRIRAEEHHTR
jgi:hypothetical protein